MRIRHRSQLLQVTFVVDSNVAQHHARSVGAIEWELQWGVQAVVSEV